MRLLARGRSVRLTGAPGSGRTTLLDAVVRDCAGLAPDGVVRLSGYHRTSADLLQTSSQRSTMHRCTAPRGPICSTWSSEIGAVVVLDDLEFGGTALEELLEATPECAYLIAATPDVAAPLAESHLEEVFLGGLSRSASLELLERAVDAAAHRGGGELGGRPLVRVGGTAAALRPGGGAAAAARSHCAAIRTASTQSVTPRISRPMHRCPSREGPGWDSPVGGATAGEDLSDDGPVATVPTLGEGVAPVALLAARLSESARATLRLRRRPRRRGPASGSSARPGGGHPRGRGTRRARPAAVCSRRSARSYRLAAGAVQQLAAGGYGEGAAAHAQTVAQHYAWWVGHPSVAPGRASAEADVVLAAMGALVPGSEPGHPSAAVLLARSAAPAFAAGLHWGAWERVAADRPGGGQDCRRGR